MGGVIGKGVEYGPDGEVQSCVFCDICAGKNRITEVIYEDEHVIVFVPLDVCASTHLLSVPKRHIRNVRSLQKSDIPLLENLYAVGSRALKQRSPDSDPKTHQFCFHVPPINSIDHLHLHCQAPPFVSPWAALKYAQGRRHCRSLEDMKGIIEKGEKVPSGLWGV